MKWDIQFPHGKTIKHLVHLDVSNLKTNWTLLSMKKMERFTMKL